MPCHGVKAGVKSGVVTVSNGVMTLSGGAGGVSIDSPDGSLKIDHPSVMGQHRCDRQNFSHR